MYKLVQNELMKIFKRPGTFVMIGLLLLMVMIAGGVFKYQQNTTTEKDYKNWKQTLQAEIDEAEKDLKDMGNVPKNQLVYIEREIAVKKYQIQHNILQNKEYSVWSFVNDTSNLIQFAGLFTIIIAAGIVASEFNWGTIKLLLIRPLARSKILGSKYLAFIVYGLIMLTILFGFSVLVGVILFGIPETPIPYLNYMDGKITEQNMVFQLVILYGLKSISVLMLGTMAFMISAVFRNSSLAIGISIFLMFTGAQLTSLLAMKFDWAKYVLFANTDLMQYFEGIPMVEGMTLTFSIIMIVIYFILFQFLAFTIFQKRDVDA